VSEAVHIDNVAAKLRADLESAAATSADVVRKEDRKRKGIHFARGLPITKNGRYVDGNFQGTGAKFGQILWEEDRNLGMICDMQGHIDAAADERFGVGGTAQQEQQDLFEKLVREEMEKEDGKIDKSKRAPYKARVALRLILMLASVLG
jgi:hypothetical protein